MTVESPTTLKYTHLKSQSSTDVPLDIISCETEIRESDIIGSSLAKELPLYFLLINSTDPKLSNMTPKPRMLYEDDPEIAAMTDEELLSSVKAMFGAWADREDITDDWLGEIRRGWGKRIDKINGTNSEDSSI